MADIVNGLPMPPVASESTPGRNQRRTNRSRKSQPQSVPQTDGTISDSVTNTNVSPLAKRHPKQRQSVATGPPTQYDNVGRANGQKPRPVSIGSHMLPATPAKEQAYAGPTFHASPAPSSLPVPRFFSKSVPNVAAAQPSLQARMDGERTPEKQDSSPEADVVEPVPTESHLSPLDLFFNADRAEKDKRRSASNLLSPKMLTKQPPATEPRNPFQLSGKNVFLRELDGDSDEMPSPRTVPSNNRPAAVERAHSSPSIRPPSSQDEGQREAYTKSLKELLFNSVNAAPSPQPTPRSEHRPHSAGYALHTPSPPHRPNSGPVTPASATEQPNHYALHYGNRDLSPLFKAARSDLPPRPSSLRQEVPNGNTQPSAAAQPPRQLPRNDSNPISHGYLDQQLRSSQPAGLPYFPPLANGMSSKVPSASHANSPVPSGQQNAQNGVSSRADGPRDIRSMEDDLRRMLKLNVLG